MGSGRRRALAASKAGSNGFDLRERIQSAGARPRIATRRTVERRPVLRPAVSALRCLIGLGLGFPFLGQIVGPIRAPARRERWLGGFCRRRGI
jgi:hypothetical protein